MWEDKKYTANNCKYLQICLSASLPPSLPCFLLDSPHKPASSNPLIHGFLSCSTCSGFNRLTLVQIFSSDPPTPSDSVLGLCPKYLVPQLGHKVPLLHPSPCNTAGSDYRGCGSAKPILAKTHLPSQHQRSTVSCFLLQAHHNHRGTKGAFLYPNPTFTSHHTHKKAVR